MEEDRMRSELQLARVARLATVDGAGKPQLVPVVFAVDGDSVVTAVDHKPKRTKQLKRLSNISTNPGVSLLVDHYEDDWSQLWWVRVDGMAIVIETGERWEWAVARLADKYPQYRGEPPTGAVIDVTIKRISGWAAS